MAKPMMVSDEAYNELKKLKGKSKSFSDVIIELVDKGKLKTGVDLRKHLGAFKGEEISYKDLRKELKAGWREWQKRYA